MSMSYLIMLKMIVILHFGLVNVPSGMPQRTFKDGKVSAEHFTQTNYGRKN